MKKRKTSGSIAALAPNVSACWEDDHGDFNRAPKKENVEALIKAELYFNIVKNMKMKDLVKKLGVKFPKRFDYLDDYMDATVEEFYQDPEAGICEVICKKSADFRGLINVGAQEFFGDL